MVCGLLMLLAASCQQPDKTTDPAPESGTPTELGQPMGAAVSKSIGPAGGTIALPDGKLTLVFPAGALSRETTISIQPIENKAPGGTGLAYRFGPDGAQFAKPVQLTWRYRPEDLAGTAPEALGIAFQGSDRVWMGTTNVTVDKNARTLTASLPHFSDWSIYEQYFMTPTEAALAPGETVQLDVFYQPGRREANPDRPDPDDLITPLVEARKMDRSQVKNWRVNGQDLGGRFDENSGALTVLNEGASATYRAPNKVPATPYNPVAVSVELVMKGGPQIQFVTNLTIAAANELTVGSRKIQTPTVTLTVAEPILSVLMTELAQDAPLANQVYLSAGVGKFTGTGTYSTDDHDFNSIVAGTSDGTSYTDMYVDQFGVRHDTHAKITVTEYNRAKKIIRGRISGSLKHFDDHTYEVKTIQVDGVFRAAMP